MMRKFFFIVLLALLSQFSFAQGDGDKQLDVLRKMAGLRSALLNKDSISLMKLLSNDVTYGHSNGMVQTKAELIRSVMSGEQDYKTITPSNMKVRIYDNIGVVTMKSDISLLMQGKPLDLSMNILLVWKKDKDWELVARQSVKL